MASTPDQIGRPTKRLKLTGPRGGHTEGLARFRMSTDGLIEEPVGSRGPPRKGGSLAARGLRASTGNISTGTASSVDQTARAMIDDVFSPTVDKTPARFPPTANGVTTPPSSDTPRESLSASAAAKRNVSGPGQFTPRALLKTEDGFEDIGIDAQEVLRRRGDGISWWMAECVIVVAQFLEHPQKGVPASLEARPKVLPRMRDGREVHHCCEKGGITHLLPCNLKKPPTAKDAFGFAGSKRDVLVSEHHASKGGINTIAFVGDIVLDKFIGESKIDEDEFKLLAGSENLRQFFGRGHKRYKAPDPNVDPTKQPILLLKSFKKMAMQDDFVQALKQKYLWALTERQDLIGEKSPEPATPLEPSPVPAFAQRAAATTPTLNIAPAPIQTHAPPAPAPPNSKKPKLETPSSAAVKKVAIKKSPDIFPDTPLVMNDARVSRRPEFPLRELSDDECARLVRAIVRIPPLINDISDPPSAIAVLPPTPVRPEVKQLAKMASPGRRGSRSRGRKSNRSSDQISLLLDAAGMTAQEDDKAPPQSRTYTETTTYAGTPSINPLPPLSRPIVGDFTLQYSSRLDGYAKTLIELVVNTIIESLPEHVRYNPQAKEVVDGRCSQLQAIVGDIDLRINTVVDGACGKAITDLYAFLLSKLPRPHSKVVRPSSPTAQLTNRAEEMDVD